MGKPGWRFYEDWSVRLRVAAGVAAAVGFIHQHNALHLDLTSRNILLAEDYVAKVI